jgi:hypothetical protein
VSVPSTVLPVDQVGRRPHVSRDSARCLGSRIAPRFGLCHHAIDRGARRRSDSRAHRLAVQALPLQRLRTSPSTSLGRVACKSLGPERCYQRTRHGVVCSPQSSPFEMGLSPAAGLVDSSTISQTYRRGSTMWVGCRCYFSDPYRTTSGVLPLQLSQEHGLSHHLEEVPGAVERYRRGLPQL